MKSAHFTLSCLLALSLSCSGDPETENTDTGNRSDADVAEHDAGGDTGLPPEDMGSDAEADSDASQDVGPDMDDDVLLVQVAEAASDNDVKVVLGRGDDVRVKDLDAQGEAEFADPGPGPYTVTLLGPDGEGAFTWAQAPGPVVRFEAPPLGSLTSIPPGSEVPVTVSGDVTGTTAGNTVTVELLADGSVYDRDEDVDGTYEIDATSFGIGAGQALHLVIIERDGNGDPVTIGIEEVTDDLQTSVDQTIDLTPDVAVDHDLEVSATNHTASSSLYATGEIVLGDGIGYEPFDFRVELMSGQGTLTLPTLTGSLQDFDIAVTVGTPNPSIALHAHQYGAETLSAPLPSMLAVDLLPQPTFVTDVGDEEPVAHAADGFSLEVSGPSSNTDPLWLFLRTSGDACGPSFLWIVNLPPTATSFTPFELREDLGFLSMPSNVGIDMSLLARKADGSRHSASEGMVELTEEETCDTPVPSWLEGEFVGIGLESQSPFVDESQIVVESCGRFRYDIEGGDFSGSFCGQAVEENGQMKLKADDQFRFLFNGETEALVEERDPAFQGLEGLALTSQSLSRTAIFVRRPDPQPATLGNMLPGMYDGAQVTFALHADDSGSPGAELSSDGPYPADGTSSVPSIGDYAAEVTSGAGYFETQAFPLAILFRKGVVTSFDGTSGKIALTNGPGIASDIDNELDLTRAVDGTITVTSFREVVDTNDADSDGDSTDSVFEALHVELAP